MKAIACAIMFGVIWHTPINAWNEFTDMSKLCVSIFGLCMFVGFCGFIAGEKS